jgi:hypothetical protein
MTRRPIEKAEGFTEAERYLRALCERTFLSMWSYPSVFRDQGRENGGDGKEVCDLLVVFDDNILIFSDKQCKFPSGGDPKVNWGRWYKAAVRDSAKQIWGAERWIRSFPNRLFLDRKCEQRFRSGCRPWNARSFTGSSSRTKHRYAAGRSSAEAEA